MVLRARAGMTLVELMIALALLVAVASLALPNMFAILSRSASAEGRRQALGALASARAEAMGRGRPMRVTAEPTARGWQIRAVEITPGEDALVEDTPRPVVLGSLPPQWVVLEAGPAVAGAEVELVEAVEAVELITFLPDGGALAPEMAPTLAAASQRFVVHVDRWSGRASIEPVRPESDLASEDAVPEDPTGRDGLDDTAFEEPAP